MNCSHVFLGHDSAVISDAPRHALCDPARVEGRLAALGQRPERLGQVRVGHNLSGRGCLPVGAKHLLPVGVIGVL